MRKTTYILSFALGLFCLSSCKEKKQDDIIITKKVVKKPVSSGPKAMSDSQWSKTVAWVGSSYKVQIVRCADKSLPMTKDEQGNKYYDNKVNVTVTRADGSTFFNRDFAKTDFREHLSPTFAADGALLGIVFDKAEGDYLSFAVSVGSPDTMSDEYIPLVLTVSRMGDIDVKKDTQLDSGNGQEEE